MLIDGKQLANNIKENVRKEVEKLKTKPCLAVVQVGNNAASNIYVRGKMKDCEECGIRSIEIKLKENVTEIELLEQIGILNSDSNIHGILVQLPLPQHIDQNKVMNRIKPEKDVDGFSPVNVGLTYTGQNGLRQCTPSGCMAMIASEFESLDGLSAVVIGRSNIVGKPMAMMLLEKNATVTICHQKTPKETLVENCRDADIIVSAVGKPGLVTNDMVSPGTVVIDVGITRGEDGKLYGDVSKDLYNRDDICISPVPGGVGLMTRAMLMVNTLEAYKAQQKKHE